MITNAIDGTAMGLIGAVQYHDWLPNAGFAPALLLVAIAFGVLYARRSDASRMGATVAAVTIMTIVTATLLRNPDTAGHWPGRDVLWWSHQKLAPTFGRRERIEAAFNVALFVPAGFAWVRLTHRRVAVVFSLGALSFLIETFQSLFARGAPDLRDWLTNTTGATIGAVSAATLSRALRRGPQRSCLLVPISPRRVVIGMICVVAATSASVKTIDMIVGIRQQRLVSELRSTFRGWTRSDVENDLLTTIQQVDGLYPNATVRTPGPTLALRYTIQWMGGTACVFATWPRDAPPIYSEATGNPCTDPVT